MNSPQDPISSRLQQLDDEVRRQNAAVPPSASPPPGLSPVSVGGVAYRSKDPKASGGLVGLFSRASTGGKVVMAACGALVAYFALTFILGLIYWLIVIAGLGLAGSIIYKLFFKPAKPQQGEPLTKVIKD